MSPFILTDEPTPNRGFVLADEEPSAGPRPYSPDAFATAREQVIRELFGPAASWERLTIPQRSQVAERLSQQFPGGGSSFRLQPPPPAPPPAPTPPPQPTAVTSPTQPTFSQVAEMAGGAAPGALEEIQRTPPQTAYIPARIKNLMKASASLVYPPWAYETLQDPEAFGIERLLAGAAVGAHQQARAIMPSEADVPAEQAGKSLRLPLEALIPAMIPLSMAASAARETGVPERTIGEAEKILMGGIIPAHLTAMPRIPRGRAVVSPEPVQPLRAKEAMATKAPEVRPIPGAPPTPTRAPEKTPIPPELMAALRRTHSAAMASISLDIAQVRDLVARSQAVPSNLREAARELVQAGEIVPVGPNTYMPRQPSQPPPAATPIPEPVAKATGIAPPEVPVPEMPAAPVTVPPVKPAPVPKISVNTSKGTVAMGRQASEVLGAMAERVETAQGEPLAGKKGFISRMEETREAAPEGMEVIGFKTFKPDWMRDPAGRGRDYFDYDEVLGVIGALRKGVWPRGKNKQQIERRGRIADAVIEAIRYDAEAEKATVAGQRRVAAEAIRSDRERAQRSKTIEDQLFKEIDVIAAEEELTGVEFGAPQARARLAEQAAAQPPERPAGLPAPRGPVVEGAADLVGDNPIGIIRDKIIRNMGGPEAVAGDFTAEGLRRALDLPDAIPITSLIQRGLVERTSTGLFRFSPRVVDATIRVVNPLGPVVEGAAELGMAPAEPISRPGAIAEAGAAGGLTRPWPGVKKGLEAEGRTVPPSYEKPTTVELPGEPTKPGGPPVRTLSFRELAAKSDEMQAKIDARHDALEKRGVSWEQQKADPELRSLYDERVRHDTAAAQRGYDGARAILEAELQDLPHESTYASLDSILREHYSLTDKPSTGVYFMSQYTGKALDSVETVRKVAEDIAKLIVARDYPQADYFLAMEGGASGIGGKTAIIQEAIRRAIAAHKKIRDFFIKDETPRVVARLEAGVPKLVEAPPPRPLLGEQAAPAPAARPNVQQPEMFTGREMIGPAITPGKKGMTVPQAAAGEELLAGMRRPEPERQVELPTAPSVQAPPNPVADLPPWAAGLPRAELFRRWQEGRIESPGDLRRVAAYFKATGPAEGYPEPGAKRAKPARSPQPSAQSVTPTPQVTPQPPRDVTLGSLAGALHGVSAYLPESLRTFPKRWEAGVDKAWWSMVQKAPKWMHLELFRQARGAGPAYVDALHNRNAMIAEYFEKSLELSGKMNVPMSAAEVQRVRRVLVGGETTNPAIRKAVEPSRALIDELQQKLIKRGYFTPEDVQQFKERFRSDPQYLRRLYTSKLLAPPKPVVTLERTGIASVTSPALMQRGEILNVKLPYMGGEPLTGKNRADFLSKYLKVDPKTGVREGYTLLRVEGDKAVLWRDIPEVIRKQMGQVEEPGFLAAKTIQEQARILANHEFFDAIRQNPEYARRPGNIQPTRRYEAPPLTEAELASGEWMRLSGDQAKWGPLADHFVRKNVAKELYAATRLRSDWGKIHARLVGLWKYEKVLLNPAAWGRNTFSSAQLADLAGLHPWMVDEWARGTTHLWKGSGLVPEAKKIGLFRVNYSQAEMNQLSQSMFRSKEQNVVLRVLDGLHEIAERGRAKTGFSPVKIYGGIENFYRYNLYRYARETLNKSPNDARRFANKWAIDYEVVSPAVRVLREMPLGAPFITFSSQAIPLTLESLAKHPIRTLKWPAMIYGVAKLSQGMIGQSQEETEAQRRLGQMHWMRYALLPKREKDGRALYWDLGYTLIWGDLLELVDSLAGQSGRRAHVSLMPVVGHPAFTIFELLLNREGFTGKDIIRPSDRGLEVPQKWANYLAKAWGPALMPPIPGITTEGGYAFEDIRKSFTGETDWLGRTRSPTAALLANLAGLRAKAVTTDELAGFAVRRAMKEIEDLKAQARQAAATLENRPALLDKEMQRVEQRAEEIIADLVRQLGEEGGRTPPGPVRAQPAIPDFVRRAIGLSP